MSEDYKDGYSDAYMGREYGHLMAHGANANEYDAGWTKGLADRAQDQEAVS